MAEETFGCMKNPATMMTCTRGMPLIRNENQIEPPYQNKDAAWKSISEETLLYQRFLIPNSSKPFLCSQAYSHEHQHHRNLNKHTDDGGQGGPG